MMVLFPKHYIGYIRLYLWLRALSVDKVNAYEIKSALLTSPFLYGNMPMLKMNTKGER